MWRRGNRAVLIVTENPTEPLLNSAFLRQPEIRLLTTFPDEGAMEMVRTERPSLIIEDVPDGGGVSLAFCEQLRTDPASRSIPMIVLTPPEVDPEPQIARNRTLLHKPLSRHEFYKAVRRFVPLPRRNTNRLKINLRFTFVIDGRVGQAFSRDFSEHGAFLKIDRVLPLGSRLDLRFVIPGAWEEICCRAVVRNTTQSDSHCASQSGMGVEFQEMKDTDRELLETFVDRHLRR